MTKRNLIGVAVALAALLAAGGLFASNMGFKLNYVMDGPGSNGSASGTNTLALPYNQQTSLVSADDLRQDIIAAAGPSDAVISISRFLRTSDSLFTYAGASAANDFNLIPGEGFRVQLNTSVAAVSYIVVGSHDPGLAIVLDGPGNNGSASGTLDYAYPYHSTAATADDLRQEINTQAGIGDAVISISRFLRTSDSLQTYAGASAANNFSLEPGKSYRIQMNTSVTQVDFIPGHF